MADPVSWLVIEPGWEVVSADGETVGEVRDVVGDTGADIFDGLAVSAGLLKTPKYVPAERVAVIYDGHVELELTKNDFDSLDDFDSPPPSERFLAP